LPIGLTAEAPRQSLFSKSNTRPTDLIGKTVIGAEILKVSYAHRLKPTRLFRSARAARLNCQASGDTPAFYYSQFKRALIRFTARATS
jgi:hypothetical protein